MMRKWIGVSLVALLAAVLAPLDSQAQDDELVLPHPDVIFAEGIDILATGMVADNESLNLYYFDDDDWHFIPYPDDVTRMYPAPPGSFNLSAHLNFEDVIFELDTEIATLQPSTAPCGQYGIEATAFNYWENYSPYAYENGRHGLPLWLPFEDPVSGLTFPCSLETGQLVHPIPQDLRWFRGRISEWSNTAISPSGEWILLTGDGSSMGLTAVYSFNTTNGNIHYLGELFFEEVTIISFWITDTQFNLFSGGLASWADRDEYVGDVTIPNSLEWAFYGIYSITYFENPPRFELMSDTTGSENSDNPQHGPCVLRMYDFQTNTRRLYDMGSICDYGITIPNGNGDRLYNALAPSGSSALVRLNLDTGTRSILYTGELEGIYSISPDGQYVILHLDDSGRTDFYLNPYPTADVPAIDASDAVLFDLTTNQMVYHFTELASPENPIMGARLIWLSPKQILIAPADQHARIVTIDQNTFSEQALSGNLQYIRDDKSWLLLQHDDYSISRYHISTNTQRGVINAFDPDRYEYSFTQDSNDDLMIAISVKKPDSEHYEKPLLCLRVSLPDTP